MIPSWQNPSYRGERRRRARILFIFLLLAGIAVAAGWRMRRIGRDSPAPVSGRAAAHSQTAPSVQDESPETASGCERAHAGSAMSDEPPASGSPDLDEESVSNKAEAGGQAGDFSVLKASALSLYRQNKLEEALQRVQAALNLGMDEGLLEFQAMLEKEIRLQRDYDGVRTTKFTVLFDGYEHEEVKHTVLGILKNAYADIGKELNHFPAEPITVILYTEKNFTDVTRAPEWSGGMFGRLDGKIRLPVQGVEEQERTLRRVLYHEFVHALLYSLTPDCPLWLHEGLAQYWSGDRGVSVGQVIPLPMLVRGFPSDARAAAVAYMESLQAVTDLISEHGMPPLRRLLRGLGEGRGLEAAFAAAYGEPFSRWAASWRPVRRREAVEEEP